MAVAAELAAGEVAVTDSLPPERRTECRKPFIRLSWRKASNADGMQGKRRREWANRVGDPVNCLLKSTLGDGIFFSAWAEEHKRHALSAAEQDER